jgi:hypothetical protein
MLSPTVRGAICSPRVCSPSTRLLVSASARRAPVLVRPRSSAGRRVAAGSTVVGHDRVRCASAGLEQRSLRVLVAALCGLLGGPRRRAAAADLPVPASVGALDRVRQDVTRRVSGGMVGVRVSMPVDDVPYWPGWPAAACAVVTARNGSTTAHCSPVKQLPAQPPPAQWCLRSAADAGGEGFPGALPRAGSGRRRSGRRARRWPRSSIPRSGRTTARPGRWRSRGPVSDR